MKELNILLNFIILLPAILSLDLDKEKINLSLNTTAKSFKLNFDNQPAPPPITTETFDAAPLADSMLKTNKRRKIIDKEDEMLMYEKPKHKKEENKEEKKIEEEKKEESKNKDNKKKKREEFIQINLFEILIENAIGIGVRSSLKYYKYLIEKDYKKYVLKISKSIGINSLVKIIFYYLKGIYKQIGQYGFTIFSIALEFYENEVKNGIINTIFLLLTIIIYQFIHKICRKLSDNLFIRGTLYGVFTFMIDTLFRNIKMKIINNHLFKI